MVGASVGVLVGLLVGVFVGTMVGEEVGAAAEGGLSSETAPSILSWAYSRSSSLV